VNGLAATPAFLESAALTSGSLYHVSACGVTLTTQLRQSLLSSVPCQNVSRPSVEFVGIGDSTLS
jgi:hypothetical protein